MQIQLQRARSLYSSAIIILLFSVSMGWSQSASHVKPVPVILDTDIGDDIDDTWALGLLLKCPELDTKLVVGDYGKAQYRAKLLAKFLQAAGRTDVAVGVGLDVEPRGAGGQADWVKDYDLKGYPGKIHTDGVKALIDEIMNSAEPVTVIAIGPAVNLAEALKREPRIAQKARVVGMFGSVRVGYDASSAVAAEWNVKAAPKAAQVVLSAPWEITITPLDTCGLVILDGERFRQIRESKDPIASLVIENYRIWSGNKTREKSTVLFDTVAVYLAARQDFCRMENLHLRVTDDGFTVIDESANRIHTATSWKSLDDYRDFLVSRLTGK